MGRVFRIRKFDDYFVSFFTSLLMSAHVFKALCNDWRTLEGLYRLIRNIEQGVYTFYLATDEFEPIGAFWGLVQDNVCYVHVAFLRHPVTPVPQYAETTIKLLTAEYPQLTKLVTDVHIDNRADRLMITKLGFKKCGISPFDNGDNFIIRYEKAV